jgi:hypothetical protein
MQIQNAAITGSFTYNGIDISDITGSEQSVTSLNDFSSSILNYTSSNNTNISALNAQSASFLAYTASNDAKITSLNTFSSSILSYTSSANTKFAGLDVASGSAITRLDSLEVASGSAITRLGALETASGSAITRLSSIESKTGSYATTGSNTFVDGQYLSSSFNPTGFSTTASLYTDGGLRVTRDAYISGTLYLNNVTVFGTQSVAYISSSQLNIGTNIISVNTDTPSIRFGGLAVYDSGSTGLTGSILWDSQDNQWIYSNPTGSDFDSAVFLVGPRNVGTLGNEPGISCNFLSKGNGLHHMTSSGIFEDGSRTCFYGTSFISSSGAACFAGSLTGSSAIFSSTLSATNLSAEGSPALGGIVSLRQDATYLPRGNGYSSIASSPSVFEFYGYTGASTYKNFTLRFDGLTNNTRREYTLPDACGTLALLSGTQTFTGTICTPRLEILRSSANNGLFLYSNSGATAIGCTMAQINGLTNDSTGNILTLASLNDGIRMVVRNDGAVGIGTTSLKSYASLTSAGQIIALSNIGIDTAQSFRLNNYYNSGTVTDRTISNGYAAALGLDNSVGAMIFATSATCVAADNNVTVSERMRITNCGNIGINFPTPSFPLTRSGMTMKAATNDGTEFVMLSCADTGFLGGALVRNGADFGVVNRTNGNLIFATNAQERLYITGAGIACFACQICAPTIKAGSSTTLTSGNITLTGFPTSMCFGNGQTLSDNGGGGLTISSVAAIGLTAGSCIFMNCTVNFGKHQKHTDGYWYRIPFRVSKNSSSGVAGTFCIVSMASTDSFNEMFIYIDYASRLQGFSDQYTQVSSRMYGVNRFSGGTPTIGDTYIFAGGSGCSINNHAPITTNIVGSCGIVVKVDFSTTVSFSSFVWGEIRIFSIENLNSYLTIPYNEL